MNQQIQQRQILLQMGVDWWIRSDSATQKISDIEQSVECASIEKAPTANTQLASSNLSEPEQVEIIASMDVDNPTHIPNLAQITHNDTDDSELHQSISREESSEQYNIIENTHINQPVLLEPLVSKSMDNETINPLVMEEVIKDGQVAIRPFELQAISYEGWVLLIDIEFLQEDNQQEQLWKNIYQALRQPVETLKFPIVTDTQMIAMSTEPMDTVELANATLAGFIFKMVKTEQVQLAFLTDISEGLDDERLVRLPLLNEMMAEPQLKKKFWQLLHE